MNAPPQSNWTERTLGWANDRENRLAAFGVGLWLVAGIVLLFLAKNVSIGVAILLSTVWLFSIAVFARTAVVNLFGPVFIYETVRIGRKRLTFILRTLYLLMLTFTLGMVFLNWLSDIGYWIPGFQGIRPGQLSQYGTIAFSTFAPIQFGVVCFLTPAYVAGCIADEKERKTLDFLFATDLKNREIIFGKMAARLVTLLMYVIAGLPVLSSLMLFGGIDPEMLLATYAATFITVLGLSAVSIYFSTIMRKPRDAIVFTYLLAGVYLIATAIAPTYLVAFPRSYGPLTILNWEVPLDTIGIWMGAGNPIFATIQYFIFGTSVEAIAEKYAITYAVIILAFIGFSVLRLRAISLNQSYGLAGGKKKKERQASKRPYCGTNPIFWKEVFVEGSHRKGWTTALGNIILAILVFMWPAIIFANTHFNDQFHFTGFTLRNNDNFVFGATVWLRVGTGVLSFLMMMGAAIRGAGVVTAEKDRDTWISLISTPLSSWEMLFGKWWGAVLSVRKFAWLMIAMWVFSMLIGAVMPFMILPTAVYLAMYIGVFGWIGVLCSCTARNTLIASIRVMMAGIFLSGGFWFVLACCCFLPMSIGRMSSRDGPEIVGVSFLAMTPPFVMGWLPLNSFNRDAMGPFHPDERPHFGVVAVAIGFFIWAGFGLIAALASMKSFRIQANRDQEPTQLERMIKPKEEIEY